MPWSGPAFTHVTIPAFPHRIQHADPVFLLGSCFTEHIADKLRHYKYKVTDNPFGILYNPVSMAVCLQRLVPQKLYTSEDLVLHDGLYHSMDHHGACSGSDRESVLTNINHSISQTGNQLQDCRYFMISPGTSIVYTYKKSNMVVGNCHKIPQDQFEKTMLTPDQCQEALENIIDSIKQVSPGAIIIWTLSPVRHIRDGLIENQKSKAALILAIDQVCRKHADNFYFPAYEIMIDQLRDYRYYANDLVHPSEEAVQIIWEMFRDAYMDEKGIGMHAQIEKVRQAMDHRFLHPRPEAISKFALKHLALIKEISGMDDTLNWEDEKQYFTGLLGKYQNQI